MEAHSGSTCRTTIATGLIFLVLLCFDDKACAMARSHPTNAVAKGTQFVQTSCGRTAYPQLCLIALSPYASKIKTSPVQLAQAALTVSLAKIQLVSKTVAEMSEADGMSPSIADDCRMTMADSVVMLQRSLETVGRLTSKNLRRHMSNLQTWLSTALTDQYVCMNSFAAAANPTESGTKVRDVKDQILNATHLISNSLSLINGIASTVPTKHKHP